MPSFSTIAQDPQIRELVQTNTLARQFKDALFPQLVFRSDTDPEEWPGQVGDSMLWTAPGLISPKTKPLKPRKDPTPSSYQVEQWEAQINQWADTIDTHIPSSIAACVDMFMRNAQQAGQRQIEQQREQRAGEYRDSLRTIIAALAIILAAFSELQAAIAKGGFLDLAEGAWLTLLARYTYGVERDPGSFAAGPVLVTNSTGNIYSGDPGDLVFLNSATSKTYRNTEAFTIGALATNVSIAVEAIELGIASTSLAGDINQLVTPLLGVAVANPSALVGADEETDALLRERCRLSLGALSPNGPRDAYAYFARSARN